MKERVGSLFSYFYFLIQWMWRKHPLVLVAFMLSSVVGLIATLIRDIGDTDWFDLWLIGLVEVVGLSLIIVGYLWTRKIR